MNNCIDSDVTKATAGAASKPTIAARLQGVRNIVTITGRISHKSEGNYDTALMMLLLSGSYYRQHYFDDINKIKITEKCLWVFLFASLVKNGRCITSLTLLHTDALDFYCLQLP